ncbi:Class I histocompatibility antigen, F10 alpha chain [Varanus komodoensis]|nr:Class I histocompatibility antigen, F10 alpha chain [Varanus komodoensis]
METLVCQAHGFYPKEIDATWRKDGEVWLQDTFRGTVAPNSDGTYYTWLGIRISPQDRGRFWCHVEHDGLLEPLDVAWEQPSGEGRPGGRREGGVEDSGRRTRTLGARRCPQEHGLRQRPPGAACAPLGAEQAQYGQAANRDLAVGQVDSPAALSG